MNQSLEYLQPIDMDRGSQHRISLAFGTVMACLGFITIAVAVFGLWLQRRREHNSGMVTCIRHTRLGLTASDQVHEISKQKLKNIRLETRAP